MLSSPAKLSQSHSTPHCSLPEEQFAKSVVNLPLLKSLIEQRELHSFHLPAHAGNNSMLPILSSAVNKYGLMQLEGTTDEDFGKVGNFFPPTGAYEESLQTATNIYGTKATMFGVNGSTGLIRGVMRLVGGSNVSVLVQRNAHRSVIHGLRDTGADLHFMVPKFNEHFDIFMPVTPDLIETSLEQHPDIKVVVVMTPTYEGLSANLQDIAQICKSRDVYLVLDASHGSLFPFSDQLPESGLNVPGVDIMVQSVHKGAGAASQTSVVHLPKTSRIERQQLMTSLLMEASTSPSTWLLASIEESIFQNSQQARKDLIKKQCDVMFHLKQRLQGIHGVEVLEVNGFQTDQMKICFSVKGFTGKQVRDHLRDHYHIDPEFFNAKCVLLSNHIGSDPEAIESLYAALNSLGAPPQHLESHCLTFSQPNLPIPDYRMRPCDVCSVHTKTEHLPLKDAVGKISAEIKSPCPPGCIVLDVGEIIQKGHLVFFKNTDDQVLVVKH